MAFRQPTFAPASRPTTAHEAKYDATATIPSPLHRDLQESQEWILFPARSAAQTHTTSTERTPRTAGLSRLSDFGSLAARSRQDEGVPYEATDGSVEDEELDSLDEGLHAFREPMTPQRSGYLDQSGSMLPRHDGLGTFPTSSPPFQEQLWHFEQYNPRKRSVGGHQRRRSSVQRRLDANEDNDAAILERERRERIEKWRMEQSRVLLDEVERQTRRRRSNAYSRRSERGAGTAGLEQAIKESVDAQTGDQPADQSKHEQVQASEDDENFWQRITRRIIRDFIGIDDAMLSVIFGESLPLENPIIHSSPGISSKSIRLDTTIPTAPASTWEGRLLDRIARELGILVQHLSDHPGAFSIPYNPSTSDYAGMPITVPTSSKSEPRLSTPTANLGATPSSSFNFKATLPEDTLPSSKSSADSTHAALWGIEEEPSTGPRQDEREYWEQSPDVKTIFRFLHSRFTSQRRPTTTTKPPLNIATTSTSDSLRRAAVIRQHHPIVSRAAAAWEQRHGYARRHSLLHGKSGSSCASSVVGSARRVGPRNGSLGSSSRNYWDIGGSTVGSGGGSMVGVGGGGGMGAWGEI